MRSRLCLPIDSNSFSQTNVKRSCQTSGPSRTHSRRVAHRERARDRGLEREGGGLTASIQADWVSHQMPWSSPSNCSVSDYSAFIPVAYLHLVPTTSSGAIDVSCGKRSIFPSSFLWERESIMSELQLTGIQTCPWDAGKSTRKGSPPW